MESKAIPESTVAPTDACVHRSLSGYGTHIPAAWSRGAIGLRRPWLQMARS
jgi:hypothetical protein